MRWILEFRYSLLLSRNGPLLRRHIVGKSTAYNDDIFATLLRFDKNNKNYIENIRQSFLEDYPDDEEFVDRFVTHELKERVIDRARYILTQIEYHITGHTSELSINSTEDVHVCLLYTSPSPRDQRGSRMPSSA